MNRDTGYKQLKMAMEVHLDFGEGDSQTVEFVCIPKPAFSVDEEVHYNPFGTRKIVDRAYWTSKQEWTYKLYGMPGMIDEYDLLQENPK